MKKGTIERYMGSMGLEIMGFRNITCHRRRRFRPGDLVVDDHDGTVGLIVWMHRDDHDGRGTSVLWCARAVGEEVR